MITIIFVRKQCKGYAVDKNSLNFADRLNQHHETTSGLKGSFHIKKKAIIPKTKLCYTPI